MSFAPVGGPAANRTNEWRRIYDELYSQAAAPEGKPSLAGWLESSTRQPFAEADLRAYFAATTDRIKALGARRILEIGCGSGLLLVPLLSTCDRYVGLDISAGALELAGIAVEESLGAPSHLTLVHAPAHDLSQLGDERFDLIIINSVAQYFPDHDYLLNVLANAAARLEPNGKVFLGDLRREELQSAFYVSLLAMQPPLPLASTAHERLVVLKAQEQELLVSPSLFARPERLPTNISHAIALLRPGHAGNELVDFRYDVILSGASTPSPALTVNWSAIGSIASLERRLAAVDDFIVTGVPNARVLRWITLAETLPTAPPGQSWQTLLTQAMACQSELDPEDVRLLARKLGWCVEFLIEADPASFAMAFQPPPTGRQ